MWLCSLQVVRSCLIFLICLFSYRRVVGDVCEGGLAEDYEAEALPCPIQGQQ